MAYLQELYVQFLSHFPNWTHTFISLALVVLLAYWVFQLVRRNIVYLIVLVVLLPASVPILRNLFEGLVAFVKFLLGAR
jgi:hypothetical protein